ncbi:MAG: DMT family transporter [Bacteroidales bacterium]|nr:DMT family transporter [Bacteroidales bacterium]
MNLSQKERFLAWGILFVLVLTWGSSFILIKRGLESFNAVQVGALRIVITFLFFIPFAFKRLKRVKKEQWIWLILSGIIGNGAPSFLFAKAQTVIDSSLAGILNSLTPLFTLIIGISFFRLKTKWYNIFGVFIGLIGAVGLIYSSSNGNFEFNFGYSIYVIIAATFYAINLNIIKYKLEELDTISIATFAFVAIGIPVSVYLFFSTDFIQVIIESPTAWKGIGYISILAIMGTAIAMIIFNKLIKMTNVVFAASVTYMIPVIALIWGIIDGEIFKLSYSIWILIILGGVFLVNRNHNKSNHRINN